MDNRERQRWHVAFFIAGLIGLAGLCQAASVEDVALLKSAERQKILVEGARKEGKLTFYTTLIIEQVVRPLKDAFEKEYPFIQMEYFRGNSDRVTQKLFAEYQAKRYAVDVVDGSSTTTMVRRAGLLQRFYSPHLAEYPAELKDADRILGREQPLLSHPRLQHAHGQTRRGAEKLRRSAASALEGPDDLVHRARRRRAVVHRQCVAKHGRGRRQGLPAEIARTKHRQEHRQLAPSARHGDRRRTADCPA